MLIWTKEILEIYKEQLELILEYTLAAWSKGHQIETNILTHIFHARRHRNCSAGKYSLAIAPNKKFYLCPAFYFENIKEDLAIGTLESGINNVYEQFCELDKSKLCDHCDANHCSKCIFMSKIKTNELCVPPEILCIKSNMEREMSKIFYDSIRNTQPEMTFENPLVGSVSELDPLLRL